MQTSHTKPLNDVSTEPVIIEEKISKKNGEVNIRKYARGKVLGKGGFATAYEFTDLEENKLFAAKIVAKSSLTKKRALEKLLAEIKIHKSLHHDNIVQFERVFEDKENVYILLEICPNQTLKELLKKRKRISELECVLYMTQIIHALKYLHAKRIIHRDLKLGNLLLGKAFDIKVADFGLAAKIEHDGEKRRTICGTPNYIAPEVLDKKIGHSYEVDIWSLGVICYTLLIGRPPYETNNTKETYKRIIKNDYTFPTSVSISDDAKDLIKSILKLDPSLRPNLDQILDHPFIKNHASKNASSIGQSQASKRLSNLVTVQSPVNGGSHLPTEPGFGLTSQRNRDSALDKNVYENDMPDHIFSSTNINKKSDRLSTNNIRPATTDARARPFSSHQPIASVSSTGQIKESNEEILAKLGIHVTKWIDYSTKYGLGYMLSDGTSGVAFNDHTKLIMPKSMNKIEYILRKGEQQRESLYVYNSEGYPKELEKKMLLLKHFKNYLQEGDEKENNEEENHIQNPMEELNKEPLVYIKKWLKTKHATMFRLSNKIIQVDFEDKTRIVLNSNQQMVYYKNKKGEMSQHPLLTALDVEYPEMVKRLKYTKEILVHIRQANNNIENNQSEDINKRIKTENEPLVDLHSVRNGIVDGNVY